MLDDHKYICAKCGAQHYGDEMLSDSAQGDDYEDYDCDLVCPTCRAWNTVKDWKHIEDSQRPPPPPQKAKWSSYNALTAEPDLQRAVEMIEDRARQLKEAGRLNAEQLDFEIRNMVTLVAQASQRRANQKKRDQVFQTWLFGITEADYKAAEDAFLADVERQRDEEAYPVTIARDEHGRRRLNGQFMLRSAIEAAVKAVRSV